MSNVCYEGGNRDKEDRAAPCPGCPSGDAASGAACACCLDATQLPGAWPGSVPALKHPCTYPPAWQVRAVVVCRPPIAHNLQRLGGDAAAAAGTLAEVDILPADDVPPDAPDADLLRYIAVGKEREHTVRLPVYGYRGGGDAAALCDREVAPLLARLLAGESSALIAYGQTGGCFGSRNLHKPHALRGAAMHVGGCSMCRRQCRASGGVAFPRAA